MNRLNILILGFFISFSFYTLEAANLLPVPWSSWPSLRKDGPQLDPLREQIHSFVTTWSPGLKQECETSNGFFQLGACLSYTCVDHYNGQSSCYGSARFACGSEPPPEPLLFELFAFYWQETLVMERGATSKEAATALVKKEGDRHKGFLIKRCADIDGKFSSSDLITEWWGEPKPGLTVISGRIELRCGIKAEGNS